MRRPGCRTEFAWSMCEPPVCSRGFVFNIFMSGLAVVPGDGEVCVMSALTKFALEVISREEIGFILISAGFLTIFILYLTLKEAKY